MRFYWFDGKAPQGPFELSELLAQPGFTSESVVCPVGAERPEDWKPAVSYEPLRDALLKPQPAPKSSPPPVQPQCPFCRHQNLDDALFCSHCGRNLKGGPASPKPPEVSAGPKRSPFPVQVARIGQPQAQPKAPAQAPSAAQPPVAAQPPSATQPPPAAQPPSATQPPAAAQPPSATQPPPAAKPPLAVKPRPAAKPAVAPIPAGRPPSPVPPPLPMAPASTASAMLKNQTLLLAAGAFCAAFVVLAGVFFWRRPAHPKALTAPVIQTTPPAPQSGTSEASPALDAAQPAAPPTPLPAVPPRVTPSKIEATATVTPAAVRPARKRRRAAPPASAPSAAGFGHGLKERSAAPLAIPAADQPAARAKIESAATVKPLAVRPGPKRRRAAPPASSPPSPKEPAPEKATPPSKTATAPSDAELGDLLKEKSAAPLAVPTAAPPEAKTPDSELFLPGIPMEVHNLAKKKAPAPAQPIARSDEAAAPPSADHILADRAKEQFNFCHQLLRQGNFGDFYDTCLCSESRSGSKRVFIDKSSHDPASEVGSAVEVVATRVQGETASITAKWSKAEATSQRTEKWVIEDGLWCLKK